MNFMELFKRLTPVRAMMLGLVVAAFYYFLFFDNGLRQETAISQSRARIAELQKEIEVNQHKLDSAAIYQKTAAEVGGTINKLLSLIPSQFGMPDLMRIVSNEVKVAGASLSTIDPRGSAVSTIAPEFDEFTINVDISGTFLQHMVFLSNLTKVNQILVVKKFEISRSSEAKLDEAPLVRLTGEIVAYRYRGEQAKKAVTQ